MGIAAFFAKGPGFRTGLGAGSGPVRRIGTGRGRLGFRLRLRLGLDRRLVRLGLGLNRRLVLRLRLLIGLRALPRLLLVMLRIVLRVVLRIVLLRLVLLRIVRLRRLRLLRHLAVAVHVAAAHVHLVIRRRHRPALAHLVVLAVAVRLHDAVVVLGVLVEILGGDAIAPRRGLARHGDVALEHLIGVAADLHARPARIEILHAIRRTRAVVVVRVAAAAHHVVVAAATAAVLLAWSHVSLEIATHFELEAVCWFPPESDSPARSVYTDG